jgi:hypothetical protein
MAISTNPAFMQFIEAQKAEAAAVGVPGAIKPTGNPALDARNLREVEEVQQRAVVEADRIVTRTNNVVDRLTGEVNAQTENITRQQERGAGDAALRPLFQQLEKSQNNLNAALAAQKEAVAAREAFSPLIAE